MLSFEMTPRASEIFRIYLGNIHSFRGSTKKIYSLNTSVEAFYICIVQFGKEFYSNYQYLLYSKEHLRILLDLKISMH